MTDSDSEKKSNKLKWIMPPFIVIYLFIIILGVLIQTSSNKYHPFALSVTMIYLGILIILHLYKPNNFMIANIVMYCLIFLYGSYIVYDNRSYFIKK